MPQSENLSYYVPHEKEGQYLTLPFNMPENIEEIQLAYHYPAHQEEYLAVYHGNFRTKERINIIDLGLVNPDGQQVGASGSNKSEIYLNVHHATPGYHPQALIPGEWQILVGAYKIAPEGVTISYELTYIPKRRQLFIGDIHTHTLASDGVLSVDELAAHAKRHGLAFLAITDHNHMVPRLSLEKIEGITMIPGVEWTHYRGHASFLGVDKPYDMPFFTQSDQEVKERFLSARARGALIVIDHPCDDECGFHFDFADLPYDCLEVWNGPMRESNLKAVHLWQTLLEAGQKIPAVGGSDYHKDGLFQILGGPCMGVYAHSDAPADILAALKEGQSFIRFAPQGPLVNLCVGDNIMGDTLSWQQGQKVQIHAGDLLKGDVIRVIANQEHTDVAQVPTDGEIEMEIPVQATGFVRVEIYRIFHPSLPPLPALISNPIYFD